jgi:hypothetical protein
MKASAVIEEAARSLVLKRRVYITIRSNEEREFMIRRVENGIVYAGSSKANGFHKLNTWIRVRDIVQIRHGGRP